MPCRFVFSGAGTAIVWSRICALMLNTVSGMWQATHARPGLPSAWRVWRRTSRPIGSWQPRQSPSVPDRRAVALHVRQVRIEVAAGAGRAALQEAAALPEAERVVREAARPAVGPVGGIAPGLLRVLEDGQEVVEVVRARGEPDRRDVPQRVALGAHHGLALGDEVGRPHDQGGAAERTTPRSAHVRLPGPWQRSQPVPKSCQSVP